MSALDTDVVSTLYNVENLTLIFVSFWTSDQRYFHVDPQLWSDVEILDGRGLLEYSKQIFSKVVDDSLSKIIIQVFFLQNLLQWWLTLPGIHICMSLRIPVIIITLSISSKND